MVKTCYIPNKRVTRTLAVYPKWSAASMHYNDKYMCHKHTMNPVFKTKNITPPSLSLNLKKRNPSQRHVLQSQRIFEYFKFLLPPPSSHLQSSRTTSG